MRQLKRCPFCGANEKATYPTISDHEDGTWSLTHFCFTTDRLPGKDLEVCITCYGKSEDEVIDRWNRRVMRIV